MLVQSRELAMRVDMTRPGELHRLIQRFLDYELPQIGEFRQARQQFKTDLPSVLEDLRAAVEAAAARNANYRTAAAAFLAVCHRTISPEVSDADVREMLLQHILTKDIFLAIFRETQFHRYNNIARQLDDLEGTFFTGDVQRQAHRPPAPLLRRHRQRRLGHYRLRRKAAVPQGHLRRLLPGLQPRRRRPPRRRLHPQRGGGLHHPRRRPPAPKTLRQAPWPTTTSSILDPATGTGTFITNLINHLPDRTAWSTSTATKSTPTRSPSSPTTSPTSTSSTPTRSAPAATWSSPTSASSTPWTTWTGRAPAGGAVTRQGAFNLGGVSEENWIRVQEQNEKSISVIIGNPPYNANQQNENDNNKNREYPAIDRRISETYIAASTAQKTKQYDMYKRFIRWASDRLADDGIIGFITNRAYLETRQDDGFRQMAAREFTDIYILDLGSDVRRNPKISGTTHNVFGIQTGVAVGFFVREQARLGECNIHYARREDAELASEKLAFLRSTPLDDIGFESIVPDAKSYWLDQSDSGFEELVPLANRETKLAKTVADEQAVFGLYSLGVITARDEWVYDFDADQVGNKVRALINEYEEKRAIHGGTTVDDAILGTVVKWTRDLKRQLRLDIPNVFERDATRLTLYRPFTSKHLYYHQNLNEMLYQLPQIFPNGNVDENEVICFLGSGGRRPFAALASAVVPSYAMFIDGTQCIPLYRYTTDGERVSNITQWGLRQFREHYGDDSITAEDIFAYTYAMLHDPAYRQRFEIDLRREFPRVYFQEDFHWWAGKGRELLDLHLNFETADPYPLERVDVDSRVRGNDGGKAILRADKERNRIVLDDQTTLTGIPDAAWWYELGSRSALEWVLDQYKERKPRDPTIRERFNTYRFADHKERVIDLLQRVCTVSVNTYRITDYELDQWTEIDPDEGLEWRPESEMDLIEQMSLANPGMPIEEVIRRLGLK